MTKYKFELVGYIEIEAENSEEAEGKIEDGDFDKDDIIFCTQVLIND